MIGFNRTDWDHLANYRSVHGPAWRWRVAGEKLTGGNFAFLAEQDPLAGMAAEFRVLAAETPDGAEQARRAQPLVGLASDLNVDETKAKQVKIMLLGGFEPHEIGEKLGIDPKVLMTWQDLFFDVGGENRCRDWLDRHVIGPTYEVDVDLALTLQLAAVGGRTAVWLIFEGDAEAALGKAHKVILERLRLSARVVTANSIPLGSQRAMLRQLKLFAQITRDEQRLKLAENKLGEKCREAERKYQVGLAREQRIREREQQRYAEREQKRLEKQAIKEARRQMKAYGERWAVAAEQAERQAVLDRAGTSPLTALTWETAAPARHEIQPAVCAAAATACEPIEVSPPALPPNRFEVVVPLAERAAERAVAHVA